MKKLILIALLASVFTLAACDSGREEITGDNTTTTIATEATTQSGLENAGTAPMDDLDWGALVPIG